MARATKKTLRSGGASGRDITVLRAEYNKAINELDEIKTKLAAHTHTLDADIRTLLNKVEARLEELITKVEGHTHDGVTVGAGATSAMTAMALAAAAAGQLGAGDHVTGAPATITYANAEAALVTAS
jgi:hypothetical protein